MKLYLYADIRCVTVFWRLVFLKIYTRTCGPRCTLNKGPDGYMGRAEMIRNLVRMKKRDSKLEIQKQARVIEI